ncbi:16S rRNA methyltransferase [Salmonella enterica subsp. arizonae]|uniref:16S rRNA methyltransferase n=1 Tax=Salmonella enterica subsp. arizonae TaxID=59203 RepID=A0A379SBX2_SALER|nr:16S rRNA methyltransferase [Salmonella enterica subsp. arizonae]
MLNKLSRLLDEAGISLTDHQKNHLVAYVGMLDKWNKAYNLTSVRDPAEMIVRHILDSIVVAPYLQGQRFIDVGTGPGLPGIPLAIVLPDAHFTLTRQSGQAGAFSASGSA